MNILNDHHSRLNPTRVRHWETPSSAEELVHLVKNTSATGQQLSICAGKGAMGGQQFLSDQTCIDLSDLNRVLFLDKENGLVKVEAGIFWDQLIEQLRTLQNVTAPENGLFWTIRQKQTGANELSIGGSVSANAHGRGLKMAPLVNDIESFEIIVASGELEHCSRTENPELFSLAIGGYGCFGIIYSVTLRLTPFQWLVRDVELVETQQVISHLEEAIQQGAQFGDSQFTIDAKHEDFLRRGIASVYYPSAHAPKDASLPQQLDKQQLTNLLALAHTSPTDAFQLYQDHYLKTDQLIYASDTHQLAAYPKNYHLEIDQQCGCIGSEMITELYVPRTCLPEFMETCRTLLKKQDAQVIYGTIRLIKQDLQSFLPWAKGDFACVIFNLHTDHCPQQLEKTKLQFRSLIDTALQFNGSYYLTYHRWATATQLNTAYPKLKDWLERKEHFDPQGLFASDWFNSIKEKIQPKENGPVSLISDTVS